LGQINVAVRDNPGGAVRDGSGQEIVAVAVGHGAAQGEKEVARPESAGVVAHATKARAGAGARVDQVAAQGTANFFEGEHRSGCGANQGTGRAVIGRDVEIRKDARSKLAKDGSGDYAAERVVLWLVDLHEHDEGG